MEPKGICSSESKFRIVVSLFIVTKLRKVSLADDPSYIRHCKVMDVNSMENQFHSRYCAGHGWLFSNKESFTVLVSDQVCVARSCKCSRHSGDERAPDPWKGSHSHLR